MTPLSMTQVYDQLSSELESLSTKYALPMPSTTENIKGWFRFFKEIQKNPLLTSPLSPHIATLALRIRDVYTKGRWFTTEQEQQIRALQPTGSSFVADAIQERRSSLPAEHATHDFYRETFFRFFHGTRSFSTYAEQFLLGTGPQELSVKIDLLFREKQTRFLGEMEEWKRQLPSKTLELKRQFLQDVQTFGLKLPPTPQNSTLEETFSTRREIWLRLASKNHFGRICTFCPFGERSESLRLLAQEYTDLVKPCQQIIATICDNFQEISDNHHTLFTRTSRGLELILPYRVTEQISDVTSTIIQAITLFKPFLDLATHRIKWSKKETKVLKRPLTPRAKDFLRAETRFSSFFPKPRSVPIVPIKLVELREYALTPSFEIAGLMERYPEGDLFMYLEKHPTLSLKTRLQFALEIAQGIQAVHEKGHGGCDIKAKNILIKPDPHGKPHASLTDLGSLEEIGTGVDFRNSYVSPEEFEAFRVSRVMPARPETDMFSFGHILMKLLYNRAILTDFSLSWEQMKQEKQIVEEESEPPPTPEAVEKARRHYLQAYIEVERCVNDMPFPELKQALRRLFALRTDLRPTAQTMVEILTRVIAEVPEE